MGTKKTGSRTYQLRNMTCGCCLHLLRLLMEREGIGIAAVRMGSVTLTPGTGKSLSWKKIEAILEAHGFGIIRDKEILLVEQIRIAVIDLVHNSTFNAMVRNSDYLVERFGLSYPYLSSLFSKHENMTLEKFIILQKIEKVKELIDYDELTLSEIAFMMGYSSVQYLSTQFKTVTGFSVTEYRNGTGTGRTGTDQVRL